MALTTYLPYNAVPIRSEKLRFFNQETRTNPEMKGSVVETVYPTSGISTAVSTLDFSIPASATLFTDVSSMKLFLKGKFVRADGTPLLNSEEKDIVVPKSHFLKSLVKHTQLYLNETAVLNDAETHLNIQAAIKHIMEVGYEDQDTSYLYDRIFYDVGRDNPVIDLKTSSTAAEPRTFSLSEDELPFIKKAFELTKFSKEFVCFGSFLPDGVEKMGLIPTHVQCRVRIQLNDPQNYMIAKSPAGNRAAHYFQITDCYLKVTKIALFDSVFRSIEASLLKKPALLPFDSWEEIVCVIPGSSTVYRNDRLIHSSNILPEKVIFFVASAQTINGSLNSDPAIFSHHFVKCIKLLVSSDAVLQEYALHASFNPTDGKSEEILREVYLSLISQMSPQARREFTFDRLFKNACLFAFDLRPETGYSVDYKFGRPLANLGVSVEFSQPTNETKVLFAMIKRENFVQIEGSARHIQILK
jgi:hypothetical protein